MKIFDSFGDGKFLSDSFSFLFEVRVLKMRDLRKSGQDFKTMEIRYHS